MKKCFMIFCLFFCSSIVGCSNDISEMGMSSAGPKDNEISSFENSYQWLRDELTTRLYIIERNDESGRYIMGKPGIVVSLSDLNDDGNLEVIIGNWLVSTSISELEFNMYSSSGEKLLAEPFYLSINSSSEEINLFGGVKFFSEQGQAFYLSICQSENYSIAYEIYEDGGEWGIYRRQIEGDSIDYGNYDNFKGYSQKSIEIYTVQIWDYDDIDEAVYKKFNTE